MKMNVELQVVYDSYNSPPHDTNLKFSVDDDVVSIILPSNQEFEVKLEDFIMMAEMFRKIK